MITDKGDYLEYYQRDPADGRTEREHQTAGVGYLRTNHPDILFWHSVNEGKKTYHSAMIDAQCGLLKGVSDYVFLIGFSRGKFSFGAIELKRTNKSGNGSASPVSDEQKEFLRKVRERGGFAAVAYGIEQLKLAIEDMLK